MGIVIGPRPAGTVADFTAVQEGSITPVFVHFMFPQFILRRQHLVALFARLGFRIMAFHVLLHVEDALTTQGTQRFFELPGFYLPLCKENDEMSSRLSKGKSIVYAGHPMYKQFPSSNLVRPVETQKVWPDVRISICR